MRRFLLTILLAIALSGCLRTDGQDAANEPQCARLLSPASIAHDAPSIGGQSGRTITMQAEGENGSYQPRQPLALWWQEKPGGHVSLAVLRTNLEGFAVVRAPTDLPIHLLYGTDDAWQTSFTLAPSQYDIVLRLQGEQILGTMEGSWRSPATVGTPLPTWQPTDLPWADKDAVSRLQALHVRLSWTNSPTGSADFGIAVGTNSSFQYWNQQSQTSFGSFHEDRELTRAQIEQYGWHQVGRLRIGPSVSTGAYAPLGIPYTLEWMAVLPAAADAADLCKKLGTMAVRDVSRPTQVSQ